MKMHQSKTGANPEGYCSDYSKLDGYDARGLDGHGVVEVWYSYRVAPYAGAGELIAMNTNGDFTLHDMSHCSCYGPTEHFEPAWVDGSKVWARFPAFRDEFRHLVEAYGFLRAKLGVPE